MSDSPNVSTEHASSFTAFLLSVLAGLGTFLGGVIVVYLVPTQNTQKLNLLMGKLQSFAAGVMIFMSLFDLIPESIASLGLVEAIIWFGMGAGLTFLLDRFVVPENVGKMEREEDGLPLADGETELNEDQARMTRVSLVTFIALGLHNLPEGFSVYLSTVKDLRLGIPLALAILLHNIPEGMCVAIPLIVTTRRPAHVLRLTLLNGLFEPFGVILAGLLLQQILTDTLLSKLLAAVAGVMTFISFWELIPMARDFLKKNDMLLVIWGLSGASVCGTLLWGIGIATGGNV